MNVAGLDLSICATGVCVLRNEQCIIKTITTEKKDFANIYERLDSAVEQIGFHLPECVDMVCIESPFVRVLPKKRSIDASSKNLIALAHLVRRHLTNRGIPFCEVAATQLKKFILGKGHGKKSLILREVFKRYDCDAKDDNQADARVLAEVARLIIQQRQGVHLDVPKYQLEVVKKVTAA